jgi:hypothetical protein
MEDPELLPSDVQPTLVDSTLSLPDTAEVSTGDAVPATEVIAIPEPILAPVSESPPPIPEDDTKPWIAQENAFLKKQKMRLETLQARLLNPSQAPTSYTTLSTKEKLLHDAVINFEAQYKELFTQRKRLATRIENEFGIQVSPKSNMNCGQIVNHRMGLEICMYIDSTDVTALQGAAHLCGCCSFCGKLL